MKKKFLEHWQIISIILMVYDYFAVAIAHFFALWLRFDCQYNSIPLNFLNIYLNSILIYAAAVVVVFYFLKLYRSIWRFASYKELYRLIVATGITLVIQLVLTLLIFGRMPISYYIFGIVAQFFLTLAIRFSYRFVLLLSSRAHGSESTIPVMVIGAGSAGQMIVRDINKSDKINEKVVCIIDDNPNKKGRTIDGVEVFGSRDDILNAVNKYSIKKIYLAIPAASSTNKRDILTICNQTSCELKVLPGYYQLANGEVGVAQTKDVAIEDLLGRDQIKVDLKEIFNYLENKTILVTGAGGSIGSELCRQIASHNPKQLILFDIYENSTYDIQLELKRKYPYLNLVTLIGSVRDFKRVNEVFEEYKPDVVYHAAAHKHVPLMEDSPCESIKNNVFGTYKVAYAALANGTKRFLLISTDKAVNPTNIMGASKRLCEMVIQTFDRLVKENKTDLLPQSFLNEEVKLPANPKTEFVAVRFGNVLGSNGSVIPLFKKQIEEGGPVTVTHPDIIRYFMTIPEAVSLVLLAGTKAKGGEIFVLDMGEPVKIVDLAKNLIKLSGHKDDIKIEFTGLRPGEKLYEEKLMAEEGLEKTDNDLIHVGKPIAFDELTFINELTSLFEISNNNDEKIWKCVEEIVTTYHPIDRKKN